MSIIEVRPGGTHRHVVEIGGREAVLVLRDYQGKPSWDKAQTVLPDGVSIVAVTPWSSVEVGSTREMTLTDLDRQASVTYSWAIVSEGRRTPVDDRPVLKLRALAGAVEARWDAVDGSSVYVLQWRTPDGEYMPANTVHGGRRRVTVDIGPLQRCVFRVQGQGRAWSVELGCTSLAWPRDPARRIDAYQSFSADSHWRARTKPCWYDRNALLDVEIWYDDPDDDLPPLLFQRTAGLSPFSQISEYFWRTDIPKQLTSWCSAPDNGRSIAEVEIDRQAAALRQRPGLMS